MYAVVHVGGSMIFVSLLFWVSYAFAEGGVRSSKTLHQLCLERLMYAPLGWFESVPSGRIMSRFSSDVSMVDQAVAQWADNIAQLTCTLTLLVVVTISVAPVCAFPFAACFGLFAFLMWATMKPARELKRATIDAMSPVLSIVSQTAEGRQSLRSMGLTQLTSEMLCEALDTYTKFFRAAQLPVDFSMVACGAISVLVGCSTAVFCALGRDHLDPAFMALALTYSFLVPYFLAFYGDVLNRLLVGLSGLERLMHYAELEQEPPRHMPNEEVLAGPAWPRAGLLEFEGVSLVYRSRAIAGCCQASARLLSISPP
ncbi:unnamed protein product [Prorocentrum cordatum]|uniref:ABC transmembrane type-1 domain-containing protein n=1 Tax=Prorocentrum cordatum TaxID=2364126 RepID=A0ABN9VQH7_9DINO|nr:unnamed protein product [Polarella glacialis]